MKKINVFAASLFIAALVVGASSLGSTTQAQSTPAVTCTVSQNSVLINTPITLTATGGNGTYTWSSANFVLNNPTTNTSSLALTYTVPGNYMVTVMSNGSTATCRVAITAIESPAPGPLTEYPAPGLPNTGELPL